MFHSHRVRRTRVIAIGLAATLTTAAVPFVVSDVAAASPGPKPAAGTVHLYIVNTSIAGRGPGDVLISGAFADHGTVKGATLHLAKGTITGNTAKLNALLGSPNFASGYSASCSFNGAGKVSLPLVSGTGAYAGIKGDLSVHVTFGAQSPFTSGKCDGNSPPIADQLVMTGSGKVSF